MFSVYSCSAALQSDQLELLCSYTLAEESCCSPFPVTCFSSPAAFRKVFQSLCRGGLDTFTSKGSENGTVERISNVVFSAAGSLSKASHSSATSSLQHNGCSAL